MRDWLRSRASTKALSEASEGLAYRSAILEAVWPRAFAIIEEVAPSLAQFDPNVWRASWKRKRRSMLASSFEIVKQRRRIAFETGRPFGVLKTRSPKTPRARTVLSASRRHRSARSRDSERSSRREWPRRHEVTCSAVISCRRS